MEQEARAGLPPPRPSLPLVFRSSPPKRRPSSVAVMTPRPMPRLGWPGYWRVRARAHAAARAPLARHDDCISCLKAHLDAEPEARRASQNACELAVRIRGVSSVR